MVASKITELLGTRGLENSNRLVVYNSNTFGNSDIVESLGLQEKEALILQTEATLSTLQTIYDILIQHKEFAPLVKNENEEFIFHNETINSINGQGFNTIIFLADEEIIGYTILLQTQADTISTDENEDNSLNRWFGIGTVIITISSDGSEIRVDKDNISLYNNVINEELRIYYGDKNYNFSKKKDLVNLRTNNNYNIYLSSVLNGDPAHDFFTDTTIAKVSARGTVEMSKLNFRKNLELGDEYTNFNHEQIGYYEGDPSIYVWDDFGNYSIFSLTKIIDFGEEVRPLPYTVPKVGISKTKIYTLPIINKDKEQSIEYFAGKYISVLSGDLRYILEIPTQSWIRDFKYSGYSSIDYYRWNGLEWEEAILGVTSEDIYSNFGIIPESKKTVGTIIGIGNKPYLNKFILDSMDKRNKIIRLEDLTWQSYKKAVEDCSDLSNTYIDFDAIRQRGIIPIRKHGDWFIFKDTNEQTLVYTNMTKAIKMRSDEKQPIFVNNQTLIARESDGSYIIYDQPGYYITKTCKDFLTLNKSDISMDSFGISYRTYSNAEMIDNSIQFNNADSPILVQKSFLSSYRRNILPSTLSDFKIIDAFAGLIYYRINNKINYL